MRIVTTDRYEFPIPVPKEDGVPHGDVFKEWGAAEKKYRELFNFPESQRLPDDALHFENRSGEIVIYFDFQPVHGPRTGYAGGLPRRLAEQNMAAGPGRAGSPEETQALGKFGGETQAPLPSGRAA